MQFLSHTCALHVRVQAYVVKHMFLIICGTLKEPTHCLKRVGQVVPGVVVYLSLISSVFHICHSRGLGGRVRSKYRLIAAASNAFTCYSPISPHKRSVNCHKTMALLKHEIIFIKNGYLHVTYLGIINTSIIATK